jgi:hypothetical protein
MHPPTVASTALDSLLEWLRADTTTLEQELLNSRDLLEQRIDKALKIDPEVEKYNREHPPKYAKVMASIANRNLADLIATTGGIAETLFWRESWSDEEREELIKIRDLWKEGKWP